MLSRPAATAERRKIERHPLEPHHHHGTTIKHSSAKNVILAGVKAVVLLDHRPATHRDLGANFYLAPDDAEAGRNRAEACRARLAELNVAVHVSALATEGPLAPEQLLALEDCDVLVLTEAATADAVRLDDACRSRKVGENPSPIAFIRADARGVFASVFTDFGDSFVVDDVDGEEPATGIGEELGFFCLDSLFFFLLIRGAREFVCVFGWVEEGGGRRERRTRKEKNVKNLEKKTHLFFSPSLE